MPNRTPARDDLALLFRDVVLVLGGVFAVEGTDDRTIRRVAAGLERVYQRARRQAAPAPRRAVLSPHPAIAGLLRLADGEGAES